MRGCFWISVLFLAFALRCTIFVNTSVAEQNFPANGHWDGKTFKGFVTLGCGDIYVHAGGGDTWFAEMDPALRAKLLQLAGVALTSQFPWATIFAELESQVRNQAHPGFFSPHQRVLVVTRILNARGLEFGESTKAASESKIYRGFVLVGPETYGFIPLSQKDEFWAVVEGEAKRSQLYGRFKPEPSSSRDGAMYQALVEIRGRVGPPGAYAHMNDFDREVAVDDFKFLHFVDPSALVGTAGVMDVNSGSGTSKIRKCINPVATP